MHAHAVHNTNTLRILECQATVGTIYKNTETVARVSVGLLAKPCKRTLAVCKGSRKDLVSF